MKAIEQYFHVVLFIMLCKVHLTVKSVDETLVDYCVAIQYDLIIIIIIIIMILLNSSSIKNYMQF